MSSSSASSSTGIEPVLPFFHYRATDASGIVENELCPSTPRTRPRPRSPTLARSWTSPGSIRAALAPAIAHAPWAFSPWLVLQARLLPFLGGTLDERGAIAS